MSIELQNQCQYNHCNHNNSKHYNGLCWEVTQPEEKGNNIYCPCTFQGEPHRLFRDLGFMYVGPLDAMITKHCRGCNSEFMLRLEENFCNGCKSSMVTLK